MQKIVFLFACLLLTSCASNPIYRAEGVENLQLSLTNRSDILKGQLLVVIGEVHASCEAKSLGEIRISHGEPKLTHLPTGKSYLLHFYYERSNWLTSHTEVISRQFLIRAEKGRIYQFNFDLDSKSFDLLASSGSLNSKARSELKSVSCRGEKS